MFDLIIIGGGPAGIAAGVYAARKNIKTLFLTKEIGGQSIVSLGIENWIGDEVVSGIELAKRLKNHIKKYESEDLVIKENVWVEKISGNNGDFSVKTKAGEFKSKKILITSGSRRKKLPAKGADVFEHKGLTYCASCDGPFFKDKDVVVVGGGNSGFETASQLMAYCKSVLVLQRGEAFKADPTTIEKVLENENVSALTNAQVTEIRGEKFVEEIDYIVNGENGEEKITKKVSGVFVEIGAVPSLDFLEENFLQKNKWGKIEIDCKNQKTSLAGVWAAGDCTDVLYHQNNIAMGDAVKALEDIYLDLKIK